MKTYGIGRKFNDKYKDVIFESVNFRAYDETTTNNYDAFFSETQIKLIELVEKYNFKIFYFNCEKKCDLKLSIKIDESIKEWEYFYSSGSVDLNCENVKKIKNLQRDDFYFLYKNKLFEVLYTFSQLDSEKNYWFNFILVVNKDFDLNKVYSHNFNLVHIKSVLEVNKKEITFDWVKDVFSKRFCINNILRDVNDVDYYDIPELNYDNFENVDYKIYRNENFNFYHSNFNQNKFVNEDFKRLCSHIWSFNKVFYKEINKFGWFYNYYDVYDINSLFLTNFAELMGEVSIEINKDENNFECTDYTYCSLLDNFYDQGINYNILNKSAVKTGFFDLDNLEEHDENFLNPV